MLLRVLGGVKQGADEEVLGRSDGIWEVFSFRAMIGGGHVLVSEATARADLTINWRRGRSLSFTELRVFLSWRSIRLSRLRLELPTCTHYNIHSFR